MLRLFIPPVLVAVALTLACDTSECKGFIRRCNGEQLEQCTPSGSLFVEETCASPNKCIPMGSDFAGCGIPDSSGGRTACDGVFVCVEGQRRVCESTSLKPDISWVSASPCLNGKTCVGDGGRTDCI